MAKKNQFLMDGLFGFDGRFRRSEYWIASFGLAIVRAVLLFVICGVLGQGLIETSRMLPIRIGLDILFLWPSAAVTIKRGHDRDRSTIYSVILLVLLYGIGWGQSVAELVFDSKLLMFAFSLLILPLAIYMLVDYGFIDGSKGANRYGPSPKNHQDAAPPDALVLD